MHSELDILLEPLYAAQTVNIGEFDESPVEHVRQQAREKLREPHHIFCEMLELCKVNGLDYSWYENARWIKYEETAEGAKQRWSKPHIPLLTLQSVFQLKNCFRRGLVMLDADPTSYPLLVDQIVREWEAGGFVDAEESIGLRAILLCNKEHVGRKRRIKHSKIPGLARRAPSLSDSQQVDSGSASDLDNIDDDEPPEADATINMELSKKLPDDAEVATIYIGRLESISKPVCAFIRLSESKMFLNLSEVPRPLRFMFILLVPEDHSEEEVDMIGRTLGALITDDVFVSVAYSAVDVTDLACGIDEFLSSILIIPPGKWRKDVRLEPNDAVANIQRETRRTAAIAHQKYRLHFFAFDGLQWTGRIFGGLVDDVRRRIPYFISDFTDSFTSFNAFSQCIAAVLYLFFANLTNIITFGGVMGAMLHYEMGVMECIVAGFLSGIIFGFFSGQPLNILSATGPVLIFEALFYKFCESQGWSFLPARFWLGTWTTVFIFILVAVDASFLVAYITRFTEEAFATLISVIFIVESIIAMSKLRYPGATPSAYADDITETNATTDEPAVLGWDLPKLRESCVCQVYDHLTQAPDMQNLSLSDCISQDGLPQCVSCPPADNAGSSFLFAVILFLTTFLLSYGFKYFRLSPFFPSKVRNIISDFSVFLSIVIMTVVSIIVGIPVRTLEVPKKFEPTKVGRTEWFVDPLHGIDWWVALACALPALLLTVLVVMDQQITAVIVNRKDNKLKKGFGYHLDLLVVSLLIFICSMLGLPFFVAATILSIAHVQSLRMESETAAPGEKPMFLGVREQRMTAIVAHILIGLSIFLTPIKQKVPLAVLLGIFLYMGVSSLEGQQFVQRLLIFFMPVKYQPDYTFLRLIALKRVHLFTAIQFVSFIMLMAIKYTKPVSMLFPIMLIVLVGVRIWMDKIFTAKECSALDDPLPVWRHLKKGNEPPQYRRRRSTRASHNSTNQLSSLGTVPRAGAVMRRLSGQLKHQQNGGDAEENEVFK